MLNIFDLFLDSLVLDLDGRNIILSIDFRTLVFGTDSLCIILWNNFDFLIIFEPENFGL